MWVLLVALIPLVAGQWPGHHQTQQAAAQPSWQQQPAAAQPQPAAPAGGRGPLEVAPAPNPGPFVHRDYHPPAGPRPLRQPVGEVEQRLRRIEVFLNLVDPECRTAYNGPMRELRRFSYPSQPDRVFHASEPDRQDTARRAGYTQETVIGRLANAPSPTCECLIPLYRRNFDNHVFRTRYETRGTYACRGNYLTAKCNNFRDFEGDLDNWAIEGYCVPYRGACGANLQLSRMTPVNNPGDDRPLTLVTSDEDRVQWGYERGWDESTLCYVWQ